MRETVSPTGLEFKLRMMKRRIQTLSVSSGSTRHLSTSTVLPTHALERQGKTVYLSRLLNMTLNEREREIRK